MQRVPSAILPGQRQSLNHVLHGPADVHQGRKSRPTPRQPFVHAVRAATTSTTTPTITATRSAWIRPCATRARKFRLTPHGHPHMRQGDNNTATLTTIATRVLDQATCNKGEKMADTKTAIRTCGVRRQPVLRHRRPSPHARPDAGYVRQGRKDLADSKTPSARAVRRQHVPRHGCFPRHTACVTQAVCAKGEKISADSTVAIRTQRLCRQPVPRLTTIATRARDAAHAMPQPISADTKTHPAGAAPRQYLSNGDRPPDRKARRSRRATPGSRYRQIQRQPSTAAPAPTTRTKRQTTGQKAVRRKRCAARVKNISRQQDGSPDLVLARQHLLPESGTEQKRA